MKCHKDNNFFKMLHQHAAKLASQNLNSQTILENMISLVAPFVSPVFTCLYTYLPHKELFSAASFNFSTCLRREEFPSHASINIFTLDSNHLFSSMSDVDSLLWWMRFITIPCNRSSISNWTVAYRISSFTEICTHLTTI